MNFIKLDATNSTNDYLKKLVSEVELESFTVVSAKHQFSGKGQMGAAWVSEKDKNLTFSVLIKDVKLITHDIFLLNKVVALTLRAFFIQMEIPNVSIKWPNDIMADSKKIAGVLIENNFKYDGSIDAIVGIGINVNQVYFHNLPNATSMKMQKYKSYKKQYLLEKFCELLQTNISNQFFSEGKVNVDYNESLFKKNQPAVYQDETQKKFMGIIQGVNQFGFLQLLLEDDSVVSYKVKEIKMLF
jgi:BirA family biotin operon repressor/biotin-[acetyl-CoA-carboxylase] ligase